MRHVIFSLIFFFISTFVFASRKEIPLNENWMFRFNYQVQPKSEWRVDLPHTWNTGDALSGKQDYYRGIGNYTKSLLIKQEWKSKRLFLRFEGVNSIADVFINGKHIGEHRGGYSAFVFEITGHVDYGKDNTLLVRVNNAGQLDVMPLVGDFNFYGGIYRDVTLLVTEPACISPLDYASPGVYLTQNKVTEDVAEVSAAVKLSNHGDARTVKVAIEIKDGEHVVCSTGKQVNLAENAEEQVVLPLEIKKPHLWNGRKDPFIYQAEITLSEGERQLDKVSQPLGLRYYKIDPEQGFFLNGRHLPLQGVCRHQDRPEIGNALQRWHHEEDVRLMVEMGVNAVRLAHYQQAEDLYELMDKSGIVTWAEIPFVGPGGYQDKGFINSPAFRENGKEQLRELIRQNYNHPAICFWGLFNELKEAGDNPIPYIQELNALAHAEDPVRPTTAASNQDGAMNFITDCIAWNRYDGWYGGTPDALGQFLDKIHREYPELRIAISEYGAGASIYHQQDSVKRGSAGGWWHPENYQTYFHIENWKILAERPFVWGTFIWNMFDFGAAHRTEGDRPGINDKGLVTFDRKVKKDAFYFYKANWNTEEPFVYITNRRHYDRINTTTDIMVFSNQPEIELLVNGKSFGIRKADDYATFEWKGINLQEGENSIEARSTQKKNSISDKVIWSVH